MKEIIRQKAKGKTIGERGKKGKRKEKIRSNLQIKIKKKQKIYQRKIKKDMKGNERKKSIERKKMK